MDSLIMQDGTRERIDFATVDAETLKRIDFTFLARDASDIELKPYPNEHACRMIDPSKCDKFRRSEKGEGENRVSLIFGRMKGSDTWNLQAFRYDKDVWTEARARAHCKRHDGILFEPAKGSEREYFGEDSIFYKKRSDGTTPYVRKFTAHALIDEKSINEEKREIEGYASTKYEDRDDDIILPEAFEASTESFLKDGVVLLFHDPRAPVGKPIKVTATATGIKLKTKILEGFAEAEKAWAMIMAGAIRAYSIGFRTLDARPEDRGVGANRKRFRVITSLEWIETSLVSIPSNRHSFFSVTKALNLGNDLNHDLDYDYAQIASRELTLTATTKALAELNSELKDGLTLMRLRQINERMKKI